MKTKTFAQKENLEIELASDIIEILKKCIQEKNSASVLFSGGSTPKGLLKILSESNLDWSKVKIGLVDDRMVPFENENSNSLTLSSIFLKNIKGNRPTFYPLVFNPDHESENLDEALNSVQAIGALDIVILGMGNDGHFASLFPNDSSSEKGLSLEKEVILCYTNAPDAPKRRISHSWNYLRSAKKLMLFITGDSKKEIIQNRENRIELPIDKVLNDSEIDPVVYWAP